MAAIKPYEASPRQNDAAVDAVARSIKEFGFRQPILVDAAAGIRMKKPKTALRVLGQAADEHADQLRERIADAIEDTRIEGLGLLQK